MKKRIEWDKERKTNDHMSFFLTASKNLQRFVVVFSSNVVEHQIILFRNPTLARSMGWITTLAKVAADPPHTNGSKVLDNEFGALASDVASNDMMLFIVG
jgi:hypothetical protein